MDAPPAQALGGDTDANKLGDRYAQLVLQHSSVNTTQSTNIEPDLKRKLAEIDASV